jgi:hypothetical protein
MGGMAGEDSRDVEDDGSLFVGERVLRGGFVSKGIEPVVEVSKCRRCVDQAGTDQVNEILM